MTQDMILALIGGILIGASSLLLMLLLGRIAGLSGILEGALSPSSEDFGWRISMLAGLVVGGVVLAIFYPAAFPETISTPTPILILAGLCVGFGTRMGGGCTSGHGVCGMSRMSKRSIIATLTFMALGFTTVYIVKHVLGGWS